MSKNVYPLISRILLAAGLAVGAGSVTRAAEAPSAGRVNFNRDVRPILSDTCFQCHGPDEQKRKSGLRLDIKDQVFKPAKSGKIPIVSAKPDSSELVSRIVNADPDEVMPPPKSTKKLKPEQIETLKRWIAQGAEYQDNWAFIKPERPAIPAVHMPGARVVNPIDNFILRRLDKEGLKQSPEALTETLLRRVSLDLTGIPPTPEELDAFLAEKSPDAYEKFVDRLLVSPRYGERMAAQWLDFARYADSNGFQADGSRQMWHWRDWVIEAFNRNLPFDKFTIDQLAGDLLPNATPDQIIATGFNRNNRLNGEGGRIVEEWFAETVIDRIETTGQTWLGLTLGCCRCHDHKFDPVTQKEFYQIFAFFNSCNESGVLESDGMNTKPVLPLPSPEQEAEMATLDEAIKVATARVTEAAKELPQLQVQWEATFREQLKPGTVTWAPLAPTAVKSEGGANFSKQVDGSWLASGTNPDNDTYVVTAPLAAGTLSGVLIDVFPDPSLPNQSLGRYSNGNFVLTSIHAEINAPGLAQPLVADFTRAEASYEQKDYEVKLIIREKSKREKGSKSPKGWAVDGNDPAKRLPRQALFVAGTPLTVPANAVLTVVLKHGAIAGHNIGRFRLSTTFLPPAVVNLEGGKVPEEIRISIGTPSKDRTDEQRNALVKFFRENADNPAKHAETALAAARKKADDLRSSLPTTMIMEELPKPREAHVLIRGEYDKPGEKVGRGLPASLPPLPAGAPLNRLGLAQWLVSGKHPLTARVWVNRAWEKFFGIGIVRTTENLGSQAEWPSHPELLDWLATEFVRLGWNMKEMQKLIVMSATYRQSSKVTTDLTEKDPENRLLARGPRFRLTAELLRDQALALSGLFVEKTGGPSVRPYMPAGVWDETSVYGDLRNYKADSGEGLYRRTLYTIWKRTSAPPTMLLFDSPTREICTVKRTRSNTPLQALALLNEATYVEAARKLAERMIAVGGPTPADRIAWAFRRVTARKPDTEEIKTLSAGLTKRLTLYRQSPDAAKKLIAVGAIQSGPEFDPAELAAYTLTANVLLNLDETVTRE
ncbi:MAG: DUF1553 domain-containing protein [Pedosphaera sp.]|nr:DUF1553 domain-containing protein [Pedosphaera sp.]